MSLKVRASATLNPPATTGSSASVSALVVERGPRRELIQDRFQRDRLVDLLEPVDAFLQPFGDRQVDRLDHVATIRLRDGLRANEGSWILRLTNSR